MKLANITLSIFTFIFSLSVWANCPAPSAIHLVCDHEHHCNWGANYPGWEGFFIGPHQQDTSIQSFNFAVWWNDHGNPENGTTLCLYTGNLGSTVRMSQGSWGGVPEPKDSGIWFPTIYDNLPVLVCRAGVAACKFNY